MIQQLKERVEEIEVRAEGQKMSVGDTITRFRRRVRTLEAGASSTTSSVLGRAGHIYVTYPALNGRDYMTRPALDEQDYVSRSDLPTPIVPPALPLCLDMRLADLEVAVLHPRGE